MEYLYKCFDYIFLNVLYFHFQQNEIGAAAFGTLSLINHSCDPNVVRHYHSSHAVVRTIRYQVSFAFDRDYNAALTGHFNLAMNCWTTTDTIMQ